MCLFVKKKDVTLYQKLNKHNNGAIYIQFFTLYRTAVNVILRLLFFVCKDS